jgi:hypothetical protein
LGISVTVDGCGVRRDGTSNSLIAILRAKRLAGNVPGVGCGQEQLRVRPSPRACD